MVSGGLLAFAVSLVVKLWNIALLLKECVQTDGPEARMLGAVL
jgi:hypothetical protein